MSIDTFDPRADTEASRVEPQIASGAAPPIRSLREYAAPILVLSARFRRRLAGSAEAARRRGVKRVLHKPCKELLAAMREAVEA